MVINPEESISNIPTNNTIVEKIASAADILGGGATTTPQDTTGGTKTSIDETPDEVVDNPTERDTATIKKAGTIVVFVGLGLLVLAFIWFMRRK